MGRWFCSSEWSYSLYHSGDHGYLLHAMDSPRWPFPSKDPFSSARDYVDDRHVSLGLLLDSFALCSVLRVPHRSCRTLLGKVFTEDVRRQNVHL